MSEIKAYIKRIKWFIQDTLQGIKNFWKFRKVIWRYRWWDYYYLMLIIKLVLEDMESHWGKDTHYVGDCFTKGRLQVLLKYLDDFFYYYDGKSWEETGPYYAMLISSGALHHFFRQLGKNIERFVD